MKKTLSFLVLVAAISMLAGCADDQYAIEKKYWHAKKMANKIFKNPHATPTVELETAVGVLDGFIQKHPKTNLALEAEINVARLYLAKEEYEKARARLQSLLVKYKDSQSISSEIMFLLGNSYEIEDNWDTALAQYKKIMLDYPATIRGLDIPVYIAQHYKLTYQPDKMIAAFQQAIAHYSALAGENPDTVLAFKADMLVAQCYIAMKDWNTALNTYNLIIDKYKDKIMVDGVLLDMALIYKRDLKDDVSAIETLQRLVKEYPDSRMTKTAAALLKELKKE